MAGIDDRIKRLEATASLARQADADHAYRSRVFARLYLEEENTRRAMAGMDPLPVPPEIREDVLHVLRHVIPSYRARGGWHSGEGKEFLDAWEDELLERLTDLQKGADE